MAWDTAAHSDDGVGHLWRQDAGQKMGVVGVILLDFSVEAVDGESAPVRFDAPRALCMYVLDKKWSAP